MTVAALYAAHLPYVRGVVRKLGVAEPEVEDVAQEVFCVLLRRPLPRTEARGVRRWLYQTTRRVVSNYRRGRRRSALRLEHAWETGPVTGPEQAVMERRARRALDRELAALPSPAQELFRLSEVEELPGPEVARRLGINPNTAYARVRALRRRLAQALLLLVVLLAALLVSQAGCKVREAPSSAVTQASPALPASEGGPSMEAESSVEGGSSGEGTADGGATLRGPALGLAALARAR